MPYTDKQKQREAQRRHYEGNREAYAARSSANRKRIIEEVRALILNYLRSHPCVDCGEDDPIVLEFDHRDPGTKLFNIGEAAQRKFAASTVAAEIAKCDVRCANCHRRMTYRRGGYKHKG